MYTGIATLSRNSAFFSLFFFTRKKQKRKKNNFFYCLKPSSYFLRRQGEFWRHSSVVTVNVAGVKHISTVSNYSWQRCDIKIKIASQEVWTGLVLSSPAGELGKLPQGDFNTKLATVINVLVQTFGWNHTFYVGLVKKIRQYLFPQLKKSCSLFYFSSTLDTVSKGSLESVTPGVTKW